MTVATTVASGDQGTRTADGNWGRWGLQDEVGTPNLVGAAEVMAAARLVEDGRVIALGQPLGAATPVPEHRQRVERLVMRDGGDYAAAAGRPGGFQFAEEVLGFAAHSGTPHRRACPRLVRRPALQRVLLRYRAQHHRAQKCGADKLVPLVTRGLLLDVCAGRQAPHEAGETVSLADLQDAAERAGVAPRAGDVVLLRTGWYGRHHSDPDCYLDREPGIDSASASWLAGLDVAAVGADNYAIEVVGGTASPVCPLAVL